jgi:drug/metabolite transporter (DMT)-like permease
MHFISTAIRGPLFMILATGSYVVNDTMMKLATEGLPPYQVLVLRGSAALAWGVPLLLALGYGRKAQLMFDGRVLARNLLELAAILAFIVALANMPIADATALGQTTPLLVLIGASIVFGEPIGWVRAALIGAGFVGALMVAQPTLQGIASSSAISSSTWPIVWERPGQSRRSTTAFPCGQ